MSPDQKENFDKVMKSLAEWQDKNPEKVIEAWKKVLSNLKEEDGWIIRGLDDNKNK